MIGNLVITAHWLCFESEKEDEPHVITKTQIKWIGVKRAEGVEKYRHDDRAKDIREVVEQLKSYCGSDLKDLNNECQVEIENFPETGKIVKGTYLGTGKYMIYEPLSFEEKCELAILLNAIEPS